MYLLAFTTVIIGILAIYAQVLTVQAAQIAARQSSLASMMLTWHAGAVSMGASITDNPPPGLILPCSLTYTPPTGLTRCPSPVNGSGIAVSKDGVNGTVTVADLTSSYDVNNIYNKKAGSPELVHLSPGYAVNLYQFYSILYYDLTTQKNAVITYVPVPSITPSNPAPGFIQLPPTFAATRFTMGDLGHQLAISGLPLYAFGAVYNGQVIAQGAVYTIPAAVANGAEAIVTTTVGY